MVGFAGVREGKARSNPAPNESGLSPAMKTGRPQSASEDFAHDEHDDGAQQSTSCNEMDQGVTDGREQGNLG